MLASILTAGLAFVPIRQGASEILYAHGGQLLRTYDPVSGVMLSSTYVPGLFSPRGLVYEEGRLFTLDQNLFILRDQFVEIHPATMRPEVVGPTGYSLNSGDVHLVRDPITDRYFAQFNESFWEVNRTTGEITFLSRIPPGTAIITAIAIDARGTVYGISYPNDWHRSQALFLVSLETGEIRHLGDFSGPFIWARAAAFDASDTLWVSGHGPFNFVNYRLFKVDIEHIQFQAAFPIAVGMTGIAFGPAPDVEAFCTSKTNSADCAPTIDWSGIPSATAHFGFEVSCSEVVNQAPGFLMLGLGGRASDPFEGGTLCVAPPILRTTPQVSGGSAAGALDCSGTWSLDVNSWLFAHHPLAPGESYTCQWWGRDPGLVGPASSQLSDALEVVLFP